jgi:hypothetical protein
MHAETPRLTDKTIAFSEHEVFNVFNSVKNILQMKNPPKISLLNTKLSNPQTYIC